MPNKKYIGVAKASRKMVPLFSNRSEYLISILPEAKKGTMPISVHDGKCTEKTILGI